MNIIKLKNVNKILDECESCENTKSKDLSETIFAKSQSYETSTKKQVDGCQSLENCTRNKLTKILYHEVIKKVTRNTKIKFL